MHSSIDGASVVSDGLTGRKYTFKTSFILLVASYLGLLALIATIIAFSAPYWLSSYKYTYSQFIRLGLWNFCFDHYRHPPYQYDESFTGCRWVYDPMYQNIRDWLQPGWFMFVQAMMTLSMLFSVFALMTVAIPIMHYAVKYNVVLIFTAFVLKSLAAVFGTIGWLVFLIKHDTRSWLLNPRFNYLDWAFYVAVIASILCYVTAALFAIEARNAKAKRQRFTNLVYNMHHPQQPTNGFEQIPLKTPPSASGRGVMSQGVASQSDIGSTGRGGGGGGGSMRNQHLQQHPQHLTDSPRQMASPSGGSSRFSRQHQQEIGSTHSSPYASISRFSASQQFHQQRTKSPPQSPLSRQFTAV